MKRADWSLRDAVIWVHDRNCRRVDDRAFQMPNITAEARYNPDSSWLAPSRAVRAALQSGQLRSFRLAPDGTETQVAAGFWNNGYTHHFPERYTDIIVRSADVVSIFPAPAPTRLRQLPERLPPDEYYVTLSEAVSWVAFRHAMDSGQLWEAIEAHPHEAGDAQEALAAAMADLAKTATNGNIELLGKYLERLGDGERTALTAPIEPIRLHDFARFDILGDGLRHGDGLLWSYGENILERALPTGRTDFYTGVMVHRNSLLGQFRPCPVPIRGVPVVKDVGDKFCPGPDFDWGAAAPLPPWWSVFQTIAWIATRSDAYVAGIVEIQRDDSDDIGRGIAFSAIHSAVARWLCKCTAKNMPADDRWNECVSCC